MKLLIIRHLPTKYNLDGMLQGCLDVNIDPPDQGQLARIAANRTEIRQAGPIDGVLCSTLLRTVATARAYGYGEDVCIREPLLNELDFGPWEGRPRQQMLDSLGELWWSNPQDLVLGEPVIALQQRITGLLEKYGHAQRLLLFSHGAWTRALISYSRIGNISDMNRIEVSNNHLLSVEITLKRGQ